MWDPMEQAEFSRCVADLLCQRDVQSMNLIEQHAEGVTCLDHCIFVSYLSFVICRRLGLDYTAAARAGLLHDMYLCDWNTTTIGLWKRLLVHPAMALENASANYALSDLEKDIILKHMWPLTLRWLPRHRESVVVNLADKICATAEMLHIYRVANIRERLLSYNLCRLRVVR